MAGNNDWLSTFVSALQPNLGPNGFGATNPDMQSQQKAQLNSDKIAADAAHKLMADPNQPLEKKALALKTWNDYQQRIENNPITLEQKQKQNKDSQITAALAQQGISTPAPAGPAPVDPFAGFGGGPQAASANPFIGNTVGSPAQTPGMDADSWIKSMLPGATITSAERSIAHNRDVGGVPNSMHLTNEARDIVLPKGTDVKQVMQAMRAAGMTEVINEGDHLHVGWRNAQEVPFAVAPSMVQPSGATNTGGVAYIPPAVIAGMMPKPSMIPNIHLPAAPTQALPADMPAAQMLDKNALLAPMAEALQPVAPQDAATRPWDRIKSMLASAGAAAASTPNGAGLGQWLLRAGTGGLQGFQNKEEMQRAEDKQYLEQLRQAKIALAQQGFNIDLKNVETGNTNAERIWQSGENRRKVTFDNMQAGDQRKVQEILANHGVAVENSQIKNQFALTGAQAQINALQSGANATNEATGRQISANMLDASGKGQEQRIDTMLTGIGQDIKTQAANPHLVTARETAASILANNPSQALRSFAQELATSGHAPEVLAPLRGDAPEVAKAKATALRQLKMSKKITDPGAQTAISIIAQMLDSNHGAAYKLAQGYKSLPSAALLLKYAVDPTKTQGQ